MLQKRPDTPELVLLAQELAYESLEKGSHIAPAPGGDEVPGNHDLFVDVVSLCHLHLRSDSLVAGQGNIFDTSGGVEEHRPMADGADQLVLQYEVAHDAEDLRIPAKLLRGPPAGDQDGVVIIRVHIVVADISLDRMAEFFGIAVVAGFEIMNHKLETFFLRRGAHRLEFLFPQAMD